MNPRLLFFRSGALRLCMLYLCVFALCGCRDYDTDMIEFRSFGLNNEPFRMGADDASTRYFNVESTATTDIVDVRTTSAQPSISSSYRLLDSNGNHYVVLTMRTRNTPGGVHPFRITIVNHDGSFTERTSSVEIVNYAKMLREYAGTYYTQDTLSEVPFRPKELRAGYNYRIRITQDESDPPNRFVCSELGYLRSGETMENVVVVVDSLTGVFTATKPIGGISNYSGIGQLSPISGYKPVQGHFIYKFSRYDTDYEGHLSF